jgi:Spy/CpxP family protein refolding chaperone
MRVMFPEPLLTNIDGERKTQIMRTRWIPLAAVVVLLAAAVAVAQPVPPAGPLSARPQAALAAYLQLTPDQIAAWQQIHKDTAAAVKPLADNARNLQKQLEAAVKAASPDPATVGKLVLSLHSVRDQIRTARDNSKAKLLGVLTPEQKTKFDAFQAAASFMRRRMGPPPAAP